jgi:Effector Associated Constant Component 1
VKKGLGVDVAIMVDSQDPLDLPDLFAWLGREEELRGKVRLQDRPLVPGEMGTLPDLIAVAIGSGGVASVLAGSLSTWLAQRKSDITLKVTGPDGRIVELKAQRVGEANALLREVLRETRSAE